MKRNLFTTALLVVAAIACGSDDDPSGDTGSSLTKACLTDCSAVAAPPCQVSSCDTTTGKCVFQPLDATPCDDGLFCTVNDTCHAGICRGEANDCGLSAASCKTAACNETTHSCHYEGQADGFVCDAKDVCATGGTCQSGACVSAAKTCHFEPAPDECHVATCNTSTGACDVFVAGNQGESCSSDPCTVDGTCNNGKCEGVPRDCSGWGDECNTASCDAAHKGCFKVPGRAGAACSKVDNCNKGTCNATGGCVLTAQNEGKACTDALTCSTGDTCHSGVCSGTPPGTTKVYFEDSFAGNAQGWTLEGPWGIAPASTDHSRSCKPPTDHTNGADQSYATTSIGGLDGEFAHDFVYMTSKAVDTSSATSLVLVFSVMPGLPFPALARGVAEVFDGKNWVNVWENLPGFDPNGYGGETSCLDPVTFAPVWTTVKVDVAAYKNAGMRVRFGTKYALPARSDGLSIDDVALASAACP